MLFRIFCAFILGIFGILLGLGIIFGAHVTIPVGLCLWALYGLIHKGD